MNIRHNFRNAEQHQAIGRWRRESARQAPSRLPYRNRARHRRRR
jgi:hypothetical protein